MTPLETVNVPGPSREFAAETRHGWESGTRGLEDILSRRRSWVPAKVILEDGQIRVRTSEWTEILRPRRIAWKSPDTFLVSGLSDKYHLKRFLFRFKNSDEAQQAVSALNVIVSTAQVEPMLSAESVPVQVVFLRRADQLFTIVSKSLFLAFLATVFGVLAGADGDPFILTIIVIILAYALLGLLFDMKEMRQKTEGWLKLERNSLSLISPIGENYISTKEVKQLSQTMLVLHSSGARLELTFSSVGHLTEALRMIKTSAPHVREQVIGSHP